jgi:hypothetical protein
VSKFKVSALGAPLLVGTVAALTLALGGETLESASDLERMSTVERVDQPGWWPTKLLPTRKDFVGSEICAQCHAGVAASVKDTAMAKALLRPEESDILRRRDGQTFRLEAYTYKVERSLRGYEFAVSQGKDSTTQPISWVFGDGGISQVYVTDHQGKFFESHFSYYSGTDTFDRTTNQPHRAESLQSAVGRNMMPEEVRKCFACHSAGVTSKGDFNNVILGVTCETCHGPGADHVAAMKAGIEGGEALIMNPGRLDRTGSVDFCGSCHMTWVDVQLGELAGAPTIRFPEYRLLNSKCWAKGDARITCVGCHDPHQPLVHDSAYYDQKCLACHMTRPAANLTADHPGKACPQSDHDCVSCHMPKQEFPDTHHSFTDHDIRIARAGEPVPN